MTLHFVVRTALRNAITDIAGGVSWRVNVDGLVEDPFEKIWPQVRNIRIPRRDNGSEHEWLRPEMVAELTRELFKDIRATHGRCLSVVMKMELDTSPFTECIVDTIRKYFRGLNANFPSRRLSRGQPR